MPRFNGSIKDGCKASLPIELSGDGQFVCSREIETQKIGAKPSSIAKAATRFVVRLLVPGERLLNPEGPRGNRRSLRFSIAPATAEC